MCSVVATVESRGVQVPSRIGDQSGQREPTISATGSGTEAVQHLLRPFIGVAYQLKNGAAAGLPIAARAGGASRDGAIYGPCMTNIKPALGPTPSTQFLAQQNLCNTLSVLAASTGVIIRDPRTKVNDAKNTTRAFLLGVDMPS